jgi:glycosyltransferase involved in cell wall biosynthesis
MKKQVICIIAEGSYPYVVGGVSGWIHHMIKGHLEKEFKILSILPSVNEGFEVKYEYPDNLLEVKTIYLADIYENKINKNRFMNYSLEEMEDINDFLDMKLTKDTLKTLLFLSDKNKSSVFDFTTSKFFWDRICRLYNENYSDKEFNGFYWSYKSVFMFLMNILQNELPEADLYHSVSTGYAGIIGVLAKLKYDKPCYLTEHGIYAREREEDILKSKWVSSEFKNIWIDYFYFLSKIAYGYSDKIISLFKYNRELQLSLGAPKDRTLIIPNGVNVDELSQIKKNKTEKFILGSVLRIVPIKDIKMMISAFKIVSEKVENIELQLLGPYEEDIEYYEECKELVEDLELADKIKFTGRVDIKDYIGNFDIFLLSSISEGQPLSILEAMAVKIPIIATDVGDCREILNAKDEFGSAGIIVPPTSYTSMANEILYLYDNEKKRIELGENGFKKVKKYYQTTDFIKRYSKLYDEGWN